MGKEKKKVKVSTVISGTLSINNTLHHIPLTVNCLGWLWEQKKTPPVFLCIIFHVWCDIICRVFSVILHVSLFILDNGKFLQHITDYYR